MFERSLENLVEKKGGIKMKFCSTFPISLKPLKKFFLTCVINFMIFEQQSKNHYSCIFLHTIPVEFTS